MIVHELATNALKYGALSAPDGRISISGKLDRINGSRTFMFSWRESGGPRVLTPTRKGFGSIILREAAESFGTVTMDFLPAGLFYRLQVDLKEFEKPRSAIALTSAPTGTH
jgi:two-component sensor histidine kinase